MNDLQLIGKNPEEEQLIEDAISVMKAMGIMQKFDKTQQIAFVRGCQAMGLNPLLKEVYPMPFWNNDLGGYALGFKVDYHVYIDRAEQSGQLDGWNIEYSGEVVKTEVVKKYKDKTGVWKERKVEVIDKTKTTLSGVITIWRKDWSRPYVSRPLKLVEVMKDTDFWNGDPYGMMEARLISRFFMQVFSKNCHKLRSDEEEYNAGTRTEVPEYEVLDPAPSAPSAIELTNLVKKAHDEMNAFPLVSGKREEYQAALAKAYKDKNAVKIGEIIQELIALKEKAIAANKPKASAKPKEKPAEKPEPEPKAEIVIDAPEAEPEAENKEMLLKDDLIKVLNLLLQTGKYEAKHVCNSLRSHYADIAPAEGDMDWTAAIWAGTTSEENLRNAIDYYAKAQKKAQKEKPVPAKATESIELVAQIDKLLQEKNIDLDDPEWQEARELIQQGSKEDDPVKLRSALALINF